MWMKSSARASAACLYAAAAFCAILVSISFARAASERVKSACRSDYFQHCSAHAVGSASLRQCMRDVGIGLSNPCIMALVQEGEITKEDIQRFQSSTAESRKGASDQAAPKKSASAGKIANTDKT